MNAQDIVKMIQAGQARQALQIINRTISGASKKQPELFFLRGLSHVALEDYKEAIGDLKLYAKKNPQNFTAQMNLAVCYSNINRFEEAAKKAKKALFIDKKSVAARTLLGKALSRLGRDSEAISVLEHAPGELADNAEIQYALGVAQMNASRYHSAIKTFDKSRNSNSAAAVNLLYSKMKLGLAEEAYGEAVKIINQNSRNQIAHNNLNFISTYFYEFDEYYVDRIRKHANDFGRLFSNPGEQGVSRNGGRRLRVGFVSSDFRQHPVGFFINKFICALSKYNFETFAYFNSIKKDELTNKIAKQFTGWRDIYGVSSKEVCDLIRNDGIDILLDLNGHTAGNRLDVFARKAAPKQGSWLGYCGPVGLNEIDFVISDGDRITPENSRIFNEKIIKLSRRMVFGGELPNLDLEIEHTRGPVKFGYFGDLQKINDFTIKRWASALATISNSTLLIMNRALSADENRSYILDRIESFGVQKERIVLSEGGDYIKYLNSYKLIDCVIDATPYSGATTTIEGLWMGVPTFTVQGKSIPSRNCAATLRQAGFPEYVANDENDVVSKIETFSQSIDKIRASRSEIRAILQDSSIFDTQSFAKEFASALNSVLEA